jgi:hypothetical protein
MELSANAQSATTTVDEKDLQIQKLRLQLQVRDKIITSQRSLLNQNGITYEEHEPYNMLQFNTSIPFKALDINAVDILSPKGDNKHMWKQVNKAKQPISAHGSFSSPHTPIHPQKVIIHFPPASSPAEGRKPMKPTEEKIQQMKFVYNTPMAQKLQMLKNKKQPVREEEEEEEESKTALEMLAGSSKPSRLEPINLPVIKNTYASTVQNGIVTQKPAQPQKFPALTLLKGRNNNSKPTIEIPVKGSESDSDDEIAHIVNKTNNSQHHMPRIIVKPNVKPAQLPQRKVVLSNDQYYKKDIKKGPQKKDIKKKPVGPSRPLHKAHTDDLLEHIKKPAKPIQSL